MQVIIPCAGRSSRFPWTRPKFLLTMPDGHLMFEWAAKPYFGKYPITFVITKEQAKTYDAEYAIRRAYPNRTDVDVCILDDFTTGPAETVYHAIKDLPEDGIIVQDCDSFFSYNITENNNFVCYVDLRQYLDIDNVALKGFVMINNDEDTLKNIVEKEVVSNYVCVGAYGFESKTQFCNSFEELKTININGEIFISHIVKQLLSVNAVFLTRRASDYFDVGSYDSYIKVKNKQSCYFVDLDGVIFYNQSNYFSNNYFKEPNPIKAAVEYFLKKQLDGATLIFTTSRPYSTRKITETALLQLGFDRFRIIYDLPHSPRVLVNDVSKTNPFPSASAINAPRDSDEFWRSIS